ncbi:DHH family phosphoesterase [Paenibacillus sp. Mc5Re-14]|uniref:DHH family phosphoesterase n=1 Tax=Paenibacillus sp. Mc5Re-14 TaxID=1030529 RepID=UPI000AF6F263|nr:DHH family phosphoesterase [Paenibacillus sp. Mc5Re-14]
MAKWIKRNNVKVKNDMLLIEKLAKVRGIKNLEEWMNPPSISVNSPYKLMNIDLIVQRIIKAIHTQELIVIVADIDTDGVCSTGTMFNYLKELTDNIKYIHAQRSHGHGVETVVDQIQEDCLVIIVDSSSNSVEGCKVLSDKGIDVLIIDHHQIDEENPYATIVNCQQGDYPNKHLSGSAMCYKVCQVLDEYLDIDLADDFLDLAAIGIVADMMDIRNMENRYLIYNGMNNILNLGIREILKQSKIDYQDGITSTNISFKIAPIIGACSRFDKIELALELVTCEDEARVKELVKEMIEMNEKRKVNQKFYVEGAVESIDDSHNIIVYVDNEIDSGFRGLIATDFVERFNKPVFVLAEFKDDEGNIIEYKGSARAVGVLPLKELCESTGLFNLTKGHEGAFGIGFIAENLPKIISFFDDTLDSTDLQKVVQYDLELHSSDIDEMDIKQVEKFSRIVGQGFPEPKFLIKGLVAEEEETKKLGKYVRAIQGANKDTIKIPCEDGFALMKFRTQDTYAKDVEDHFYANFATEIDAIGSLNINRFYHGGYKRWITTKQVFLEDYNIIE